MAHRSSSDPRGLTTLERMAVVALGVYLAAVGAKVIATGGWTYANYLHTQVAAPIALVIGAVLIYAGIAARQ